MLGDGCRSSTEIMHAPYEPPNSICSLELRERKVFPYCIVATVTILCAVLIAFPGLVLLNQELGWIPTKGRVFNVEYDGKAVPLRTAMRDSLLFGTVVFLPGILLAARGLLNLRWNSKIASKSIEPNKNLPAFDAHT